MLPTDPDIQQLIMNNQIVFGAFFMFFLSAIFWHLILGDK